MGLAFFVPKMFLVFFQTLEQNKGKRSLIMDKRLENVCKELGEKLSAETVAVVDRFLAENPNYSEEKLKESFKLIKALSEKN